MTRYRFNPDLNLDLDYAGDPTTGGTVVLSVPGTSVDVEVPASWVVKVKVLPEEPPDDSVARVDIDVYWRRDEASPRQDEKHWQDIATGAWFSWAEVCQGDAPVRLVPDPFAEPVELPFSIGPVEVARTKPDGTFVYLGFDEPDRQFAHLTDDQARNIARALWAAGRRRDRAETSDG